MNARHWRPSPVWRVRLQGLALGGALGGLLAAALWHEALVEVWDLREALAEPPVPLAAQAEVLPAAMASAAPTWTGPGLADSDAAWLWLRERLQASGLQVQALQTEAVQAGPVLASQLAQLSVLGAWRDWLAFSAQTAAQAPWWGWEQWQWQPAGAAPGQVQLEARLRLWLRPERTPAGDWAAQPLNAVPAPPPHSPPHSPLWASPATTPTEPASTAAAPQAAASVADARWSGIWTQGGHSRQVLGQGLEWRLRAPVRSGGTP